MRAWEAESDGATVTSDIPIPESAIVARERKRVLQELTRRVVEDASNRDVLRTKSKGAGET